MASENTHRGQPAQTGAPQAASIDTIEQLLKAKDDTSRFVGLALVKSTLDTSESLRNDEKVITSLWNSIPSKFLDRLLKTGSKPGARQNDAKEMLDLAVAVIYNFSILLPSETKSDQKLVGRVPLLVDAILQSSEETSDIILKALLTIVSASPEGRTAFAAIEDWSPLIEIAPKSPMVLSILAWSWVYGQYEDKKTMSLRVNKAIESLVASYKGTDAVTLLDFLAKLLGRLNPEVIPPNPRWLGDVIKFVRGLTASKPTAVSREAYTNCVANLLVAYQEPASKLIFTDSLKASSQSHLLINLILIDIRASLPTLLEKLNTPEYPALSERLTSALIILSFFVNYLLETFAEVTEETSAPSPFPQDEAMTLLKVRDSVVETLSLLMEYLRDRWDAAIAGAQGLHPDARYGESHTVSGSLKTLAWDSKHESASEDRLLLAALRVLGDWLREDDSPGLRREATGMMDLLMDLYQPSSAARVGITTRPLVLGILDGILKIDEGIEALLEHDGWDVLKRDLLKILSDSRQDDALEHSLGQHIAVILSELADTRTTTPEDWLDIVTAVAAYDVPSASQPSLPLQHLWADVLQLSATLLSRAPPGVKRRYVHSASALTGIAAAMLKKKLEDGVRHDVADAAAILDSDPVLGGR
ncbi:uncharacterized protein JN550_012957 [Neoarthrinium moseri]|uniref:uncharacterized protein n=1 Tax=Neoarthrinium moseri TaxID=1658444 RepID=UPI001FDDEC9B|nr:uncharacterized protein JN550_012957 [Neoarthrinium moseri]KAI1857882.1 hypothetical protein JN550_012957 [Neoarthrinium moseri]